MTTYTKEIALYNTDAIEGDIDGAAQTATNYLTAVTNGGLWVTPSNAKPTENGAVVANTTTGWHIADVLEYFYKGVSYFKMWLVSSVARFRIGKENANRFEISSNTLSAYDSSGNQYFEVSAGGLFFGRSMAPSLDRFNDLEMHVRGTVYFPTEDSTAQAGKTYYTRSSVTNYIVSDMATGQSASGLYERSDGAYVATGDLTVKAGKVYYEAETDYEYALYEVNQGGSVTGKYEATQGGLEGSIADNAALIADVEQARANLEEATFGAGGLSENVASIGTELRSALYVDPVTNTVNVGYMDESGAFVNSHTQVSSEGFDVYYGSKLVGHYGSTVSLGDADGTHMVASGDHLGFVDSNNNEVAYIDVDQNGESVFYMTRSVVVKDMFFGDGKWKWYKRDNNNMGLKWMGGE